MIEKHILLANVQNQINLLDELMDQLEEVCMGLSFTYAFQIRRFE